MMCLTATKRYNLNLYKGSSPTVVHEKKKMLDITRDRPIKIAVRVQVPVRDHPKFNFVGKLLGPKGNSLKRLQEETMCKMAVLGKGSMRDRKKEEELRLSGDPRYAHLSEDLHVEISTYTAPAEAHARIAYALAEVRRFLVPCFLSLNDS
uniref:K Homology domain-containing protein n=1 Tax=Anopheles farauti TaxID=69004 RepID=A0A182QPD4_9DIPT